MRIKTPPARRKRPFAVRNSKIHGRGVFATELIPKGTRLIEYKGEIITWAVADRRYADDGKNGYHTFLFDIDGKKVIDAAVGGNDARWINHSCAPNCQAWIVEHASGDPRKDRVMIEARRNIRRGEELTYDYGIVLEERQTPELKRIWACRCGASRCTGTLLKPKRARRTPAKA